PFTAHNAECVVVSEFTGKLLVQQEPDASSFPNGGIRNTFEARGYSAWDISSPAFIIGDTLCIPTVFISYTGESLDYKTPLLKALNSVDKAATRVAKYFDKSVNHVKSYLGWEQEYFLVDEALYDARPDLVMTGRTLMGHESAKNQQLEDHYFGSIPMRVAAFMLDLETECHKLGIPAKTRHNEVAPNQFELAPIFEEANLANDHNQLLMSLMTEVARKHNFRVLLHEKPFAGINGSGKHNNWSLGTDTGVLLFAPGKTPEQNLQFITFVANVMAAVHKHNALMKASIMTATNAHRLGANEAPPAIISMFLGSQLSKILESIEATEEDATINFDGKGKVNLDIAQIPELMIDNTDRNRTSPFAFTGNRFEYRAVGSTANCASALIALNAAVADQLNQFADKVDARVANGEQLNQAIFKEMRQLIIDSKAIHFDGNGYSEEWKKEAAERGLDVESSAPLMYDAYTRPESLEMFKRTGVLTAKEVEARNEVKWEMYSKKVQIESRVLGDLAINHIIPAATRYQSLLLDNVYKIKELFKGEKMEKIAANDLNAIEQMADY
ncbi:MAG: glutamine synthetase III, partial [Muribaculaceae bacterium]|nr:glutamine synthetase III [Muribaculaceae bacterium]